MLGVSTNSLKTQRSFAKSLRLPFPLLSDHDGAVAKAYGVYRHGVADRVTFVIAPDGRIAKVISGLAAFSPSAAVRACPVEGHDSI